MRNHPPTMFHDEAAHDLERRVAILAGIAVAIGLLYWVLYRAAF